MTNKELIETAKDAMKDMWDVNHGKLLQHEQAAYNCLRLFCDRVQDDSSPFKKILVKKDGGTHHLTDREVARWENDGSIEAGDILYKVVTDTLY